MAADGGVSTPPARSTEEALRLVRLHKDYDLRDERPYASAEIQRVFLLRDEVEPVPDVRRHVILVFPHELYGRPPTSLTADDAIGVLRPVQRYVLTAGLQRAQEIIDEVRRRRSPEADEWGFVRVRKGRAPELVAVTPPILEELPLDDREAFDDRAEFIVCDGTHRVVQAVWRPKAPKRRALPAVAVRGPIPHPYYARPFSRYEWDVTSRNEVLTEPDLYSKYAPRVVDRDALSPEAQAMLARFSDHELYRRYFRDLTKGFGPMGGQGGRYA